MATIANRVLTKTRLTIVAAALAVCLVVSGSIAADAQARALDLAQQSRPSDPSPAGEQPYYELYLNALCGDWLIWWEEDADGNFVPGTAIVECNGEEIPLG